MRLPSASALDRAMRCPASCALPRIETESSAYAVRGTEFHAWVEEARASGREKATAALTSPETRKMAEGFDLSWIPMDAEHEVAFGYHVATGRAICLDFKGKRAYPNEPGWIYGTADLVWIEDGCVYVFDFKTGEPVVSAKDGMQLRFLAMAYAKVTGADCAKVGFGYVLPDGSRQDDLAEFDAFELLSVKDQIESMVRAIERARAQVARKEFPLTRMGPHCKYCPAQTVCPAHTSLLRSLVESEPSAEEVITAQMRAMTPSELEIAWDQLHRVEAMALLIRKSFAAVVGDGEVEFSDGRVLTHTHTSKRKILKGALAMLIEKVGVEAADAAARLSVGGISKSALKDLAAAGFVGTDWTTSLGAKLRKKTSKK